MLDAAGASPGAGRAFLWAARSRSLVLPARFARQAGFGAAAERSAASGWPVETRKTGGGIVPQGPGVLNLAIVVRPERSRALADGYAAITGPLAEAFAGLGLRAETGAVPRSFCDGKDNLGIGGRKIVGTAQRWRQGAVLTHALVLVSLDLDAAVPAAQALADAVVPEDRYDRAAHISLAELLPDVDALGVEFAVGLDEALGRRGIAAWRPG